MISEQLQKNYESFIYEAENFFVSKYIRSGTIDNEIKNCLDIVFDVTKTVDSNRGIIAFSPKYGQGKSFFFDVLDHWFFRIKKQKLFKRTTAKELAAIYTDKSTNDDPQKRLDDFINCRFLFIDDIGDEGEEKVFHNYSNSLNVLRYVLLKRYEFWNEKGWKTFATTNLTLEQIASNYDGRVADRLLQMCHWREFTFLKSGSFRQVSETRKLNQMEIKNNLEKHAPTETPVEKVDLEKYFNDLINESDEYINSRPASFWEFVKKYLIDKEFLTESDFKNKITSEELSKSKVILRSETREYEKGKLKYAPAKMRENAITKALNQISKNNVYDFAANFIAKEKFIELRNKKHVFK